MFWNVLNLLDLFSPTLVKLAISVEIYSGITRFQTLISLRFRTQSLPSLRVVFCPLAVGLAQLSCLKWLVAFRRTDRARVSLVRPILDHVKTATVTPDDRPNFVTRDSIYAIARICYRPSVCPSVCLSVTRVYHTKTVEVGIMKFLPYRSPIPLVFAL